MRYPVIRIQVRAADGPSTVRKPGAFLKVDWGKRGTPPTPVIRGATEIPEAATGEGRIGKSYVLASVQLLGAVGRIEPPAFQHADVDGRVGEPAGNRDAGRSGPNDADLTTKDRVLRDRATVEMHVESVFLVDVVSNCGQARRTYTAAHPRKIVNVLRS
jgi:hypothetical protein